MASELFLFPFPTALDANAIVVPGAKLYFYLTGTTTPTPVYSDSGLVTPLSNPVEANAAGVWPAIYYDTTVNYRVVLKTSGGSTLGDVDPYIPGVLGAITPALQALYDDTVAEAAAAAASAADAADSFTSTTRLIAGNPVILGAEIYNSPAVEGEWPLTLYCPFAGTVSQIVTQDLGAGGGNYDITVLVNDVPEYTDTITPASDLVTASPGITVALGDKVTVLFDTFTGTVSNIGFSLFVQPTALGTVPGMSGDITTNSDFTMATNKLLGRSTASTGAIEQISVGTGLSLSGGSLSVTAGATWTLFDTQTPSGTTATFTIPSTATDVMIVAAGISHNHASTSKYPYVRFGWSDGSWTTASNWTAGTHAPSASVYGLIQVDNRSAPAFLWRGTGVNGTTNKGAVNISASVVGQIVRQDSGAVVDRIELSWQTGESFDAGTIKGYYR